MSTASEILRSYRRPGDVVRRFRDAGADDGLALTWLIIACLLMFVARLPELARTTYFDPDDTPLFALALPTFFGTVLLAPLLFYGVAALSHLVARVFGGSGRWLDARLALFWALLAATPLTLLNGLVAGFIGPGRQLGIVSAVAFLAFLWIWLRGLIILQRER